MMFGALDASITRSPNIEDRRKEMFNSHPQQQQMPNVFWDKLMGPQNMTNLSQDDFVPQQPVAPGSLSDHAGAAILQHFIDQYYEARK